MEQVCVDAVKLNCTLTCKYIASDNEYQHVQVLHKATGWITQHFSKPVRAQGGLIL
jgi:hypothetical protein